jgi:hypothetical protein
MAHWWNIMPQYSALFDHHGRVRPAYYAFRWLGQLEGPRFRVEGETDNLRAIGGDGNGYKHLIVWRYGTEGPEEAEVRLEVSGAPDRNARIVELVPDAPVNNLRVSFFGPVDSLSHVPLSLKPWDIRWIEVE